VGTLTAEQAKHITNRVRVFASVPEMCDACKTMVEELHRRLHALSNHHLEELEQKPHLATKSDESMAYVRNFSKAMNHAVDALCDSEKYDHFGVHMREGCKIMLHGDRAKHVRNIIHTVHPMHAQHGLREHGRGYVPKHTVWRKRMLCEDVFGVCPESPPPVPMSDCRACAEVFRDFHYVTRRDTSIGHTRPHFKNPVAYRRKRLYGQVLDLCHDVPMRHGFAHAEQVEESCHKLMEDHKEAVIDIYLNETKEPGCPAERVCVTVAKACSKRHFKRVHGHLEHEHDWNKRAKVLSGVLAGAEYDEL